MYPNAGDQTNNDPRAGGDPQRPAQQYSQPPLQYGQYGQPTGGGSFPPQEPWAAAPAVKAKRRRS